MFQRGGKKRRMKENEESMDRGSTKMVVLFVVLVFF